MTYWLARQSIALLEPMPQLEIIRVHFCGTPLGSGIATAGSGLAEDFRLRLGKGILIASLPLLAVLLVLLSRRGPQAPKGHGPAQVIDMYCAAGIKPPVEELARQFEAEYGVTVRLQYGGSGTLLSSLTVTDDHDLYLAADSSYTDIARERGLVKEVLPLAYLTPVIAVAAGNPLGIGTVEDLLQPGLRLAIGNPDAASIGKQTRKLLTASGHWAQLADQVRDAGVFKPTVPEIANDVKIGAVDAGIVWDATARQYEDLEIVSVPELAAGRLDVVVGVLSASSRSTLALRFARFLNSVRGNVVFQQHRYDAVAGDAWAWQPEVTFFCGAVNRQAIAQVVAAWSAREGVTVNMMYNGCGILTAQMRALRQAPGATGFPDVYMACDRYYLDTVADWFQEDVDVSDADIVIVVPAGNPGAIKSLTDLTKPGVRVAVGQPQQCTIGVLTQQLLERAGILDQVMANVVTQTASSAMLVPAVVTGSVDATIAYVTDTRAVGDGVEVIAIDSPRAKAIQPFSLARDSAYKHLGRRLFAAVSGARDAFEAAGFHYRLDDTEKP